MLSYTLTLICKLKPTFRHCLCKLFYFLHFFCTSLELDVVVWYAGYHKPVGRLFCCTHAYLFQFADIFFN